MSKSGRVIITQEQRFHLLAEKQRTKVGVIKLLRGTRQQRPQGISVTMIEGWMSGEISTANPTQLSWVIERYRDYQPKTKIKPKSDRIPITEEMHQHLMSERARTGLGTVNIMRHLLSPLPKGLTKNVIQSWYLGTAKSAKATHWDCVISTYKALPDVK